jgi:LacI family transcriptional regulator
LTPFLNSHFKNIQKINKEGKIRIKDIAEKANVSIGTVDRVIHNRSEVSKTTREKILTVIKELNYEPNLIARSLATKKKNTFAVLIPYFTEDNTYWRTPMEGIEKAGTEIRDYGVRLVKFLFDQYNVDSFKKESKKVLKILPDAVLLAPVFYKESLSFVKKCESANIPYLFIDSNIKNQNNISYIGQDSFQSGYLAARLLSYGLTGSLNFMIIHVARETENTNHLRQREEGFRFFFKNNSRFRNTQIKHIFIPGSEKDVTSRILKSCFHEKTDGVFVTSNAHKVAGIMAKNKLSDIRFTGYDLTPDNLKFLEQGVIDFLICQKPFEQGYQGVFSLFNHLVLKKQVNKNSYVPIDIITRENYRYYKD